MMWSRRIAKRCSACAPRAGIQRSAPRRARSGLSLGGAWPPASWLPLIGIYALFVSWLFLAAGLLGDLR
jgi:hypothetical protein